MSEPNKSLSLRERRRMAKRMLLYRFIAPLVCRPAVVSAHPALVVAPHQDDETFGCGGLIALKRAAGVPVTVVFVTDGSRCNGDNLTSFERDALISRRESEAIHALSRLSVSHDAIHFLRLPDGGLSCLADGSLQSFHTILRRILKNAKEIEVYTPHRRDSHPDHEACTAMVKKEVVRMGLSQTIYEYPVWLFWSRNRFFGNLYPSDFRRGMRVDVRPALHLKHEAIKEYTSQLATLPSGFVEQFEWGSECFFRSTNDA